LDRDRDSSGDGVIESGMFVEDGETLRDALFEDGELPLEDVELLYAI
jgi:hypothetical protein